MLDVHLMLTNTDAWIDRYAEAGSNLLTVHRQFCNDVSASLKQIRSRGAQAGLVVELGDALSIEELHLGIVDRLLVMGTEIGVKGLGLHRDTTQRIGTILDLCSRVGRRPEIVVDAAYVARLCLCWPKLVPTRIIRVAGFRRARPMCCAELDSCARNQASLESIPSPSVKI